LHKIRWRQPSSGHLAEARRCRDEQAEAEAEEANEEAEAALEDAPLA
jgi:hypothetical protein